MPRIFLLPDQRYVEASDLETVLSACLRVGIPITNECGGNARCSTCRVLVLNGLGHCSPRSEKERALAEQLHFSDRVRLACQTTLTGNVTIRRLILDAEDAGLTDQRKEATAHGLVGEERQIAILFVDVRDSTSFAESVPPFDVIHILRRFYHHMDKAVMDNGGHIAWYAGDGLMALFGIESPECAPLQAVRTGLDMLHSVKRNIQPYVKRLFQRPFRIGVGAHFGEVVVGMVGGGLQERVTALGDAVNIASRIERENKQARTEFLVSEALLREVKGHVRVGKSLNVKLPGKTGKYTLHEVVGIRTARGKQQTGARPSVQHERAGSANPKGERTA
jgi:adenylate cyclase